MSEITVAKLKEKLQNVIDDLNELGISGYDGGYLDLDNVAEHVVEDDDDDYDEEE